MTARQLKNSILQMAVQGKLVSQDPNDEPACILLKRIREEKEKLIKAGKIKREKNPSEIFRGADNLPYEKIGKETRCIADEIPFEIPDSWEWVRLRTIVFNHGQKIPSHQFCYIDIGSIDNNRNTLNDQEKIIDANKAPSRARRIVALGDILYSTVRPYLHNMCIVDRQFSKEIIASTGLAVFACYSGLENRFLFRYLMSPDFDSYANSTDISKGIAYPAINDGKLYDALFPLPPLAEQKRIVAKIEELLPHLEDYDRAETQVSKLNAEFPEQLKKSILQWAIQGKLVPQDPADEPASVLLERIWAEKAKLVKTGKIKKDKNESVIFRRDNSHYEKLNGVERCIDDEIPFEIPENWAWTRLETMITLLSGQDFSPTEYNSKHDGVPYITGASNIEDGNIIINRWTQAPRNIAQQNDLLIVCKGAGVGKMAILQNSRVHIARQIMAVRCYNLVSNKYLMLFLTTQINRIRSQMNGLIPGIDRQVMLSILTPLPPLVEQKRIVVAIDCLFRKLTS